MKFEKWKKVSRKGDALINPFKGLPTPPEGEDVMLLLADEEQQAFWSCLPVFHSAPEWDFREWGPGSNYSPTHYMIVRAPWSIG